MEGAWRRGEARTLESLAATHKEYKDKGQGVRSRLMGFYNAEFQVNIYVLRQLCLGRKRSVANSVKFYGCS